MRKCVWSLVLVLMLLSCMCWALPDVTVNIVDNDITSLDKAHFKVNVTNEQSTSQKFTLFSIDIGQWNAEPYPLSNKVFTLAPQESRVVDYYVTPLGTYPPGIYYVSLTVDSELSGTYESKLKMYLSPVGKIEYNPAVKAIIDMPTKINPNEPLSIKLSLENKNQLDLKNMKLKIESEMPEFNKEVFVELLPLGKKIVEFSVIPNPYQQPKNYVLKFVFERYNEPFKVVERDLEVISLLPSFSVSEPVERNVFLKIFREFTIKNEGNVLNTQVAKYPINLLEALLTQGDAEVITENNQKFISWELALGPGESKLAYSITNYRLLFYIIVLLALVIGFYLYVRSPLLVKKKATILKKDDEGALSEIKVTLEVKNTSKHPVKDVEVVDLIPAYAVLAQDHSEEGAIKPHKSHRSKAGTKVHWSLSDLDPGEHRVLTYKMRAKLNILGMIKLPRASAEFIRKGGRRIKAYSGQFNLGEK